ncbi:MAG TPA: beta-ketoacyl-ACP synthase III [Chitinispirillaceae bacterium]|nr:beta-ketoacyl-ACP synthase III [Chitinispirillaceae bacterium]
MSKFKRSYIASVGTNVPDNIMYNKEFETFLDTTDEWIASRTGIKKRHIAPRETDLKASELGAVAIKRALEKAGLGPQDVDGIICATFTPDNFFPSTACKIQALTGCTKAFAYDISAACAGFVYALTTANSLIVSGAADNIVVVGSEVISKTLDWKDRTTCILFGDGAGAVVLRGTNDESKGVLATHLQSDGNLGDILVLPSRGADTTMKMKGNEVFKHAVRMMSEVSQKVLESIGYSVNDIDLLIPHQANIRIIQAVADRLNVPFEKVVANVERYGNTSSASIPLALEDAWNGGRVNSGSRVLFTALGGGVTAGSVMVRF